MRYLRSFALATALAFLVLPAVPLGGIVPVPTVGGVAFATTVPDPVLDCMAGYDAAGMDPTQCLGPPSTPDVCSNRDMLPIESTLVVCALWAPPPASHICLVTEVMILIVGAVARD